MVGSVYRLYLTSWSRRCARRRGELPPVAASTSRSATRPKGEDTAFRPRATYHDHSSQCISFSIKGAMITFATVFGSHENAGRRWPVNLSSSPAFIPEYERLQCPIQRKNHENPPSRPRPGRVRENRRTERSVDPPPRKNHLVKRKRRCPCAGASCGGRQSFSFWASSPCSLCLGPYTSDCSGLFPPRKNCKASTMQTPPRCSPQTDSSWARTLYKTVRA